MLVSCALFIQLPLNNQSQSLSNGKWDDSSWIELLRVWHSARTEFVLQGFTFHLGGQIYQQRGNECSDFLTDQNKEVNKMIL